MARYSLSTCSITVGFRTALWLITDLLPSQVLTVCPYPIGPPLSGAPVELGDSVMLVVL